MRTILTALAFAICTTLSAKIKVEVKNHTPQTEYAASLLTGIDGKYKIHIAVANEGEAEGFTIVRKGKNVTITGNTPSGTIYGVNKLLEIYGLKGSLESITTITEVPEMKLRGACIGLQKTTYLPGHKVYEYPYTPENFPWFYDKDLWIKYLDMLASDNMNAVYLWNGHPFASLVKLKGYPFAPEVDDATMQKNQEMFTFLTTEASRRGIQIIQMFYNIIVSKPFADHYGIATQDRNRPIIPVIADYTRKSIAAFIEQYPNVGFMLTLGEAMSGIENDIKWMTETIIPGVKDGLKASGRTDFPPIILRAHDTDGPLVLSKSLPLYPNIYTMAKYTGESLTTYQPRGPWAENHRKLAAAAPIHISNVHILANLEPFRWASPAFTQKTVQAMHNVHHANGLHLYPQASYWDWPFTADKLPNGARELQIDRDWMWYKAWGRYSWNCQQADGDRDFWLKQLRDFYGCDESTASRILTAYDESGEIAPKLIRRFGITEGNRQTLLLGMRMAQLVNPYKFTVYPGFYESCGPEGEKLIEYVEKEWKHQSHVGELPLNIIEECVSHGTKAVDAISQSCVVTKNRDEFERFCNDMYCYKTYAEAFRLKVLAAQQVLNYKWSKDARYLYRAIPLLEQSVKVWKKLVGLTQDSYLYANSMQTAQRRIPIGGGNGNYKTWAEMLPVYEQELANLKANTAKLVSSDSSGADAVQIVAAKDADVNLISPSQTVTLEKGAMIFPRRAEVVDSVAPELQGMHALVLNRDDARTKGVTVEFESKKPVKMLVGFFIDEDNKYAAPPKLETDATGNDYGQAEAILSNAIALKLSPKVNVHAYHFAAGHHTINLPRGIILVAGFTETDLRPRDVGLNGAGDEVDWLFAN